MSPSEPTVRDAVIALAISYYFEEGHSLQDECLALRLFDETARLGLHSLASPESPDNPPGATEMAPRDFLSCAALLHDIGYWIGYEEHHKHAYRLIMAQPIAGLSPASQTLVALIARYHRGSQPVPAKHEPFAGLPPDDQLLVTQLGAILRFADGLDRTHTNAVQDLHCELNGATLQVTLVPGRDDETERWAGQKKARWFESVFRVKVLLR